MLNNEESLIVFNKVNTFQVAAHKKHYLFILAVVAIWSFIAFEDLFGQAFLPLLLLV